MTRVLMVLPRDRVRDAVEALYDLQLLHVRDHTEGRNGLALGKPLEGASEASVLLIRLRALIATLELVRRRLDNPLPVAKVMEELEGKFDHLEREIESLGENRSRLEAERRSLEMQIEGLEPFMALALDLDLYKPYESVDVFVGSVSSDPSKPLEKAGIPHELFRPRGVGQAGPVALFIDKDHTDEVRTVLGDVGFSPHTIPEADGDPRGLRVSLKEGLSKVSASLEEVELGIKRIRDTYGDLLIAGEEHLSIVVEKAESPLRFGATPNTMVVEGWVPSGRMAELESTLSEAVSDSFHIEPLVEEASGHGQGEAEVASDGGEPAEDTEEEHVDEARATPVLQRNPKPVAPYQFLVGLVSNPRYDEIDPSIFMYFTFPVFFGMMLGDIGYGLILLIGGWVLLNYIVNPTVRLLIKMIMVSGVVTVFFGALYGEAMGFELYGRHGIFWAHDLYIPSLDLYLPINRLTDAMLMIKLCVYMGIFHVLLGLTIGFWNAKMKHGLGHAILAKASWFLIIIGGFIVFKLFFSGAEISMSDPAILAGLSLMMGGILMLIAGEGGSGVLELPGVISNILSYTRLFAIGLSSLGIAMTFNTLGGMLWETGVVGAFCALLVGLGGHLLNIFLGILGPTLHSLRLHYVEWMTKFYTGGGSLYTPFGRTRIYTEV